MLTMHVTQDLQCTMVEKRGVFICCPLQGELVCSIFPFFPSFDPYSYLFFPFTFFCLGLWTPFTPWTQASCRYQTRCCCRLQTIFAWENCMNVIAYVAHGIRYFGKHCIAALTYMIHVQPIHSLHPLYLFMQSVTFISPIKSTSIVQVCQLSHGLVFNRFTQPNWYWSQYPSNTLAYRISRFLMYNLTRLHPISHICIDLKSCHSTRLGIYW